VLACRYSQDVLCTPHEPLLKWNRDMIAQSAPSLYLSCGYELWGTSIALPGRVIAAHLQGLREPLRVPLQRVQGRVEDARRDRRVHQLVDAHLAKHRQCAAQGGTQNQIWRTMPSLSCCATSVGINVCWRSCITQAVC